MYKRRKRIAAALISTTLILSNLASILPQGIVYASDGTTQEEQSQDEGLHEVYVPEEPIPAEEPAPVQAPAEENAGNEEASGEAAGAEAPADAQTAELSVNAEAAEQPAAAPGAGMDAAAVASDAGLESDAAEQEGSAALIDGEEAAENGASASAESSGAGESGEVNAVTIYYIADEGGSVSVPSEIVRAAEGGQASGSEAVAADGYTFTGWITLDGTVVCTDALFVPGVTPEMTGEVKYTAHFEKAAEEAPATKMVTAEYAAGKGGSVSRTSETVDALAEGAAFLGSTAAAEDGYAFVNWTAADGTEVSKDATFVPAVGQDTAEKSVYTANFKKIITMPAQDFEGTAGSVHVSVHADEGNFPEGTTMHLKTVSTSSILNNDSVQDAVGKDREVVDAVAVDITFQDKEGNEIEPAGTISVRMTTSSRVEGESHEVLHIDDNGNASAVTSASATGASFDAGEFSIYVITGIGTAEQYPAIATYIFHDADGNVIAGSTQKVRDGETVYAPTTPEKRGHKFVGWSYTKDAATLQEGDPGVFDQLTASVNTTGDVNLYPVFQQVYYVFFLDNLGRVSTTKEGTSGEDIQVSDVVIPLDSTHSVTGWYTDSKLTEESKVEDAVTLKDHNVTLYPKVEQGNYLYFVSGEGASYVKPAFVAAEKETAAPEVPTRPGYTFRFWSATENGSAYKFGEKITKDTTLYAVWNAKKDTKYTIIYWWENANDEDYSYHKHEEKSGTTGSTINIKSISETYEGFTLNEDKTSEANNGVTISGDGSTIVNIYFKRDVYNIHFYKYEKVGGTSWFPRYSWNEMTSLRITAKYGANISDQWPTSTSKIWGTKTSSKWWGEQAVGPYQSGISTMPLDGHKFYYVEQSGDYTMNLNYLLEDLDGNEYVLDHTDSFKSDNSTWSTTAEDHYDIEGFSYAKNVKDGTILGSTDNKWVYEVSFKYNRNSYSITFINGGSSSSQTFKYGADISKVDLTPPERPAGTPKEYKFAGWFDNELGAGNPVVLTGTMPAYNITLYAKWAAPTYKGTVHTKIEGTGKTIEIQIDYGGTINENSMPSVVDADGNLIQKGTGNATVIVPVNYSWVGWATKDGEDFTLYNFNTKLHSDITLYPYYINTQRFAVKYDKGEGSGTAPTDSREYAENSFADIKPALEITPPGGKTFLYWTANGAKYYPGDKVKITGNLTLKAEYGDTAGLAFLIYHSNYPNGEDLTTEPESHENNTAITLAEAGFAAPKDYYFAGWNTKKDGSGNSYAAGTVVGVDNTSDNHLYAIWEKLGEMTLSATGYEGEYDGNTHSASASASVTEGTTISYQVGNEEWTTEVPSIKDVGEKTVNVKAEHANYKTATTTVTLKVTPKAVTVTAENKSKTYGTDDPALTATVSGTLVGDTVRYTLSRVEGENVGRYAITPAGDESQGNYTVTYKPGTLTINKAGAAGLNLSATGYEGEYDGNTHSASASASVTEGTTISYKVGDDGEWTTEAPSIKDVGEKTVNVKAEHANYETATTTVTLKVTPKAVTVTADDKSKTYGTDDPALTATVSGTLDNDTVSYKLSRAEGENVGEYAITPAGDESQGNYTVTYKPGTLTINKAGAAGLNLSATGYEGKYDGNTHSASASASVTEGTTISYQVGNEEWTTEVPSIKDVGEKTVNVKAEHANYETATATVTLQVTPKAVTVTAENKSKTYGTDDPALTATVSGTLGGDTVRYMLSRAEGETVGTYVITPAGDESQGNYTVSYVPGTLTISKAGAAGLNLSATGYEGKYDGNAHAASASASVTEGTTISYQVGNEEWTTEAPSIRDVGEKTVSVKAENANYETAEVTVTLKVLKRELTLTSDSASKEYDGTPLTAHHVTIGGDGLAEGETAEFAFTGSQTEVGSSENRFTAKISRSSVENTNPAPVRRLMRLMAVLLPDDQDSTEHEDSQTGAPEDNYDITYVYGTLTVTAKAEPQPQPENPGGGGGTTTNTTTTTVYQPVVVPKVLGASRVIPVQEPVQEAEQPPVVEQKVLGATRTGSAVPMTGDDSSMGFYGWIALIAAAGMMGWLAADRKRRKNH